jgi:hypothetical protein
LKLSSPDNTPPLAVNSQQQQQSQPEIHKSCSQEAANPVVFEEMLSVDELAGYLENGLHIPRKMSQMAEMMYT